jgi:energy-coupling factor transporter ATP-binding protein EcfA2
MREVSAAKSAAGRDIGAIPPIENYKRRRKAEGSLRAFCETYFEHKFTLAWSDDHLKVIEKLEQVITNSDMLAIAMPRGSGKTTLAAETGGIWAKLTGAHSFTFLIGSTADAAVRLLANIKAEFMFNDLLAADFPEVCYPIRSLQGEARRCSGQTYQGKKTGISWSQNELILPTIPGSNASGSLIRTAGIEGNIRGAVYTTMDGRSVRPTLAIIDDPQTDDSAKSPSQCASRLATLNGAILGLAGPGKTCGAIVPCTVIRSDDLADQLLDRERNPLWRGERTRLLYGMPENEELWDQYGEVLEDCATSDEGTGRATAFYEANRAAMDKGAEPAWPARYDKKRGEVSATQHAMNLLIRDPAAFWAEYQNEPLAQAMAEGVATADQMVEKINGRKRAEVPSTAENLTAFVDVQGKALYYLVAAWSPGFTGAVVDYGAYPDPNRAYFSLRDIKKTLQKAKPGAGLEGAILAGLDALCNQLLGRDYIRDDGTKVQIDRLLIDANWGQSTDVVRQFARTSQHSARVYPSHGRYVGASSAPMADAKRKKGEKVGHNWRVTPIKRQRHVLYDTNYWKSFIHGRVLIPLGDTGGLTFWGNKPATHRMVADHCAAEIATKTSGRGREVNEWKLKPGGPDNHLFDCLVGSAVAASIAGSKTSGITTLQRPATKKPTNAAPKRRRVTYL